MFHEVHEKSYFSLFHYINCTKNYLFISYFHIIYVFVKLLSQYNHDELNSDINKVAKIDEEFTEITQVLNHRFKGSKKNLANLELYLTWEDDPKPQWFPWNSSFRSVEVIHRYFEDNQMRRFIPTEFTWGKDHPEYIPPNHSRKQRS